MSLHAGERRSHLGLALALTLVCACARGETVLRPLYRFVDAPYRMDGVTEPARATLRDDTRTVLHGFPETTLFRAEPIAVPPGGLLPLRMTLPPQLSGARRLILQPEVQVTWEWAPLPTRVATVREEEGEERVAVDLDLPRPASGEVGLQVVGRVALEDDRFVHETSEVDIPAEAILEFAIGILEPAWGEGSVAFSVQACQAGECEPLFEETLDPGREEARGWQERRISLEPQTRRRLAFRFESRALTPGARGFTLPVWANPTIYAREPRSEEEVNIILISMDTLRADHLPTYGYPRDTAPFVDAQLARRGTVFEACASAATATGPSHMTMFTSLLPSVHGVRGNTGYRPLPDAAVTLAEALRARGFETGAFTENAAVAGHRGFERGFNSYAENKDPTQNGVMGHIEATLGHGRRWLERHGSKPFFLFLHTYQVHNPYRPPPEYEHYFTETIPGLEPHPRLGPPWQPVLYDREIRYSDDELRKFVGEIEAAGLLENTILIFTSDHGEEFFEHGFRGHGADIHEEILHVPLVMVGSGIPAGRRVSASVGLIDLMPTILDLVGAPPTGGEAGRSFAALARGRATQESWPRRPLYSEAWRTPGIHLDGVIEIDQPTLAVRLGTRKLIRYRDGESFRYELFDLARDPGERVDLYADEGDSVADLRALLDRYEEDAAAERAELLEASTERPVSPEPVPDRRREEKLRALGYVE